MDNGIMEPNRKNLFTAIVLIVQELIDSSSSSSESDYEECLIVEKINQRRNVPRVQNYVEKIVPALTDQDFKAHFRY
jgi:hypothetical protein